VETVAADFLCRQVYIQSVLSAYRQTPGTTGTIRRADRQLAEQLYTRGIPLEAVENAMVLATARRLFRPAEAPALGIIRSLAYFTPVIEEVLEQHVRPTYFQYLRYKIRRSLQTTNSR